VCTWPILKGYAALGEALAQLRSWMERKGYRCLDDFRGTTAAGLKEPAEVWGRFLEQGPYQGIRVDTQRCTACGACVHACFFNAITVDEEGKAAIDEARCSGCGCCYHVCPVDAVLAPARA
jgi:ferredoxin